MGRSSREDLERLVESILRASSSFCLDNDEERLALTDALVVDILNGFLIVRKMDPEFALGSVE